MYKDWGGKPFDDIMFGMDHILEQHAWIDPGRQVALGTSYGVFNQVTIAYAAEELFFVEWEFDGSPTTSDLYDKYSPHKFVDQWKTPALIIHGGKDYRVVDAEGIGAFTALQRRGIESRFLYFPDENHWVLNPANCVVWQREVLEWINKFTIEQ